MRWAGGPWKSGKCGSSTARWRRQRRLASHGTASAQNCTLKGPRASAESQPRIRMWQSIAS
eukprot:9566346-Alexandrium_andersonii.AAC.1